MKLSDYKNEEALDVLADIIEPLSIILADKECSGVIKGGTIAASAKAILKTHPKEVIAILAALDRKDPSEYECTLYTVPVKLLEILNDPEMISFFTLLGQKN